jgi:DNA mismatch endonuclease (patch repair protein)
MAYRTAEEEEPGPEVVDKISIDARSRNMAAIRGKDTKPELAIRRALHRLGFRYRLHGTDLPGKPDMVFPKYKAVIQVNGCFWHGHDCGTAKVPQSRVEYWGPKIERTKARDAATVAAIDAMGWRSLTIWECCMRGKGSPGLEWAVETAARWLAEGGQTSQIPG